MPSPPLTARPQPHRSFLRTHHHAIIIIIVIAVVVMFLVIAGGIAGYLLWKTGRSKKVQFYMSSEDVLRSDSKDNCCITTAGGNYSLKLTYDGKATIVDNTTKNVLDSTATVGKAKAPYKLKLNHGIILSGSLGVHAWEIVGKTSNDNDMRVDPPSPSTKYSNSSGFITKLAIYDSIPGIVDASGDLIKGVVVGYNSAGSAIWASIKEDTSTTSSTDFILNLQEGTYKTYPSQFPKFKSTPE